MIDNKIILNQRIIHGLESQEEISYLNLKNIIQLEPNDALFEPHFMGFLLKSPLSIEPICNQITTRMAGKHVLIALESRQLTGYVFVSYQWLIQELNVSLTLEKFAECARLLALQWEKEESILALRHRDFRLRYMVSAFPRLLTRTYFAQQLYSYIQEISQLLHKPGLDVAVDNECQLILDLEERISHSFHVPVPSVQEMARRTGMSISKFKLLFQELFGESPHQHFLTKKMAYADLLLQSEKYSLSQIAYMLGYSHPSGFLRIFNRHRQHSSTLL
ncbi:helix-turn-helix transcriptional regulator [Arundinibacter roseus]|nr:AraC family transcriptional regulator [Arundinibacter roseus]